MTTQLSSTPIMDRLKAETSRAHALTEAIPFSAAMMEQRLPQASFIGQLLSYRRIHETLESLLASSGNPSIRSVWREDLVKTNLLERDIAYFRADDSHLSPETESVTSNFVNWLHHLGTNEEVALLGVLYVLEGSTLGAMVLKPRIAETFNLVDDNGLTYYTPYGSKLMPHWREFKERMNNAVLEDSDQSSVIRAAEQTFEHIGNILRSLSHGL